MGWSRDIKFFNPTRNQGLILEATFTLVLKGFIIACGVKLFHKV